MCMKYVNAIATCFSFIEKENGVLTLVAPFDGIKAEENEKKEPFLKEFSIQTQIDIRGTATEERKKENPLESGVTLDFIIRLTKCSPDTSQQMGYDLDTFSLNLDEKKKNNEISRACFDFLTYSRNTKITNFKLPHGRGNYVIKILIKKSQDSDYTIQSMTKLTIS